MFLVAYFFGALAKVLDIALNIYMWIVIIRAIVSWVNPDPHNPIVQFLYRVTEPLLRSIRRLLPPMWGIDFSPLVVILGIIFLQNFLVGALFRMAWEFR